MITPSKLCTCVSSTPFLVSEPIQPLHSSGPPHALTFSKGMDYDQLAEWLTNILGEGYQQDIIKLKGIHITPILIYDYADTNIYLSLDIR